MALKIEKGKQQILYNYLPGRPFDFGKNSVIAIVSSVRGSTFHELNNSLVLRKVNEQARGWSENYRPALRNDILNDESRFVIVDPKSVNSTIFPLVFWCTNKSCKKIIDYTQQNNVPNSKTCPRCKSATHKLIQLRFIKVHRCGHIEPLTPPRCNSCHSTNMALDDRNSERISNFRWKCLDCNTKQNIFFGRCPKCTWPGGDPTKQNMEVEVFRSSRTFYVHSATLINIPQNDYDSFFKIPSWHFISTAKYLGLSSVGSAKISDYSRNVMIGNRNNTINNDEIIELLNKLQAKEISQEEYINETLKLSQRTNPTIAELEHQVIEQSGLPDHFWENAKYNILDAVVPFELGSFKDLIVSDLAISKANDLGISRVSLINDFPIIIASYGFSRTDYTPNECYLQPFPIDRENGGKYPIYIDKVNADAIVFRLNYSRVIDWLRFNGFDPKIPQGADDEISAKAYFIELFHDINVYEKLFRDTAEAKMVMCLLHTFSHLAIKHAALLCGLDKTSISEYIIPKTLSTAIYCNHRFGATIGALTSLFDQSITEWLTQIESERKCVYDPVCYDKGASCHSCSHLAETSCRFFNLNLGRIYLFGGHDPELNIDIKGFIDFI